MSIIDNLNLIRETGVVAIMRTENSKQLITAADVIKAGRVRVIEVKMTAPGALVVIGDATSLEVSI
jgi:2-keto-3-deoxy-6-phosphogluconate aldolase